MKKTRDVGALTTPDEKSCLDRRCGLEILLGSNLHRGKDPTKTSLPTYGALLIGNFMRAVWDTFKDTIILSATTKQQ